jgi:hypothetical protein
MSPLLLPITAEAEIDPTSALQLASFGHWANTLKLEANPAIPSRQSREAVSILRLRCMEVPSWAIAAVLRLGGFSCMDRLGDREQFPDPQGRKKTLLRIWDFLRESGPTLPRLQPGLQYVEFSSGTHRQCVNSEAMLLSGSK